MSGKINRGMFTSNSDDYGTPQLLFNELDAEFHFECDVCANERNHKCEKYYSVEENGLLQDWSGFRTVFMNPPYGAEIKFWVKKAYDESKKGTTVVCLLPSRTDTKWFQDYCIDKKAELRFIRGRLKFNDEKNAAPFPSVIAIFRGK